jgi:rhomboid protease GluP
VRAGVFDNGVSLVKQYQPRGRHGVWARAAKLAPTADELVCREEGFAVEDLATGQGNKPVPYARVHSVVRAKCGPLDFLLVGIERAMPLVVRRAATGKARSIHVIQSELNRWVASGSSGLAQTRLLAQREVLFRRLMKPPWFTVVLIAVLVGVWNLLDTGSQLNPFSDDSRVAAFIPALFAAGEIHRIVTAGFMHSDVSHLFLNSVELFIFGWIVEAVIGAKRTALLVFGASIAGFGAHYLVFAGDGHLRLVQAVGSSAGIWGLYGATTIITSINRKDLPVGFRIVVPILCWWTMLYQVHTSWLGQSWPAHFGGGLFGLLVTIWITSNSGGVLLSESPKVKAGVYLACFAALLSAFMAVRNDGHSETRYFALLHERLVNPDASSAEITHISWIFAGSDATPTESLRLSLQRMHGLADQHPELAYKHTLATLYYRLGEFQRALEIMRPVWNENPSTWPAIQLSRFYAAAHHAKSSGRPELGDEYELLSQRIEARIGESTSRNKLRLGLSFAEATSGPSTVHALMYDGDALVGFIDASVGAGLIDAPCDFDKTFLDGLHVESLEIRPVWYDRPKSTVDTGKGPCILSRLAPGAMDIP